MLWLITALLSLLAGLVLVLFDGFGHHLHHLITIGIIALGLVTAVIGLWIVKNESKK
jgi:VIT1/CCC1 family predicted Fe2+/Mn2+ transporter